MREEQALVRAARLARDIFSILYALSNYFSHNCETPRVRGWCWGVWAV
jgi:hypothetical protein